VAVFTGHADRSWGIWAAGGYALAAVIAAVWRSRVPDRLARFGAERGTDLALLTGLVGALAVPMTWLVARWPATADVTVVARSAALMLRNGTPYLPPEQLGSWQSYDPYLPVMAIFGLPRSAGARGLVGDPRLWLTVTCVVLLAAAFRIAAPHCASRYTRCVTCRRDALRYTAIVAASPLVAFPLALGITDPVVLALLFLAFACVGIAAGARGRGRDGAGPAWQGPAWQAALRRIGLSRPVAAALAIGVACAMKATAWPALAVIAAMLAARDGGRAALRFTLTSVITSAVLTAAAAPALLTRPAASFQNLILFPLGMAKHQTPAASPLPGHLLAATGPVGHLAALGLLGLAGLAMAVSLVWRPPLDVRAAAWRLAIGFTLLFTLAPATRWGYFAYPVGLLGWLVLTRPERITADTAGATPEFGTQTSVSSAGLPGHWMQLGKAFPRKAFRP
jgi:hypothetical protein